MSGVHLGKNVNLLIIVAQKLLEDIFNIHFLSLLIGLPGWSRYLKSVFCQRFTEMETDDYHIEKYGDFSGIKFVGSWAPNLWGRGPHNRNNRGHSWFYCVDCPHLIASAEHCWNYPAWKTWTRLSHIPTLVFGPWLQITSSSKDRGNQTIH